MEAVTERKSLLRLREELRTLRADKPAEYAALTPRYRLITDKFCDEVPIEKIAATLVLTVRSVEWHLYETRRTLRTNRRLVPQTAFAYNQRDYRSVEEMLRAHPEWYWALAGEERLVIDRLRGGKSLSEISLMSGISALAILYHIQRKFSDSKAMEEFSQRMRKEAAFNWSHPPVDQRPDSEHLSYPSKKQGQ